MGAPKPPTTEIEVPDPLIVKQYTPRSVEYALGELYKNTAANAALSGAKRDATLASLLNKPYTGTFDAEGQKIDISRAPTAFDPAVFFDPDKNLYLAQEIEAAAKKRRNKRMRRLDRMSSEGEDKISVGGVFDAPRDKYLGAINRVRLNT